MDRIDSALLTTFDYVWQRFVDRLDGITDDEYFWEPVADAWSVRQDRNRVWILDGDDRTAEPEPAPFTTIAWRTCHIGRDVLGMFADRLFGSETDDIPLPGSVAEIGAFLDTNYQAWRSGIEGFTEEEWWSPLGEGWGPYSQDSKVDLALHVYDELVHHAAEVGLLRDLNVHRASWREASSLFD